MMDLAKIAYVLQELSETSSTTQRTAILRKNASVEGFKDVLKHLYNPYITTGIKQAKLDSVLPMRSRSEELTPEEVLEYFSTTRTGSAADVAYAVDFIEQYDDPIVRWLATGIITKDLQCGVSTTTLNKVYGTGFIPKIGIMRGRLAPDTYKGKYSATENKNGNRA